MPPPESKHEQVMQEAALRFKAGTDPARFHYPVGVVLRPDEFDVAHLAKGRDLGHQVIYEMFPGDENLQLRTTGTSQDDFEIWLLISRWRAPTSTTPFKEQGPSRQLIQSRLLRDLRVRIEDWRADVSGASGVPLGSLNVASLEIRDVNRTKYVTEQVVWDQVEARLVCEYHLAKGAP